MLALLLGAVYLNRDWVLALFNRNSTLTGRVPLWGDLLGTYVTQRPLGGYGLNAFWHQVSHRIAMQLAAGYPDPIVVSDNGFLDLLLNLGFVGIALFFLFYFDLWRRVANMAWRATDVFGLFPLIAMAYILVAKSDMEFALRKRELLHACDDYHVLLDGRGGKEQRTRVTQRWLEAPESGLGNVLGRRCLSTPSVRGLQFQDYR